MPNVIGTIPEFTTDETVSKGVEEVKEAPTEEVVEKEKETPSEPPAEEKPLVPETVEEDEKQKLEKAVLGLQNEREKLLREVSALKGTRREIKQEQILKVENEIDELKDVNPEDVNLITRVLRGKGFVTKEEAGKMFYESVKQETLNKFLEKYPEYKRENDPNDIHWSAFERELGYYQMPKDPHKILEVLERAHRGISPSVSDRTVTTKKRQIEVAGVGSGGVQRSSSVKTLDPHRRLMLEQGGWTKEEIDRIEKNLT